MIRDVTSNMMIPHWPVLALKKFFKMSRTLNIVSISQTAELFLSSGVPCVEANLTKVGMECDGVDFRISCIEDVERILFTFNTKRGDVFLLKLARKMSLDKSCLVQRVSNAIERCDDVGTPNSHLSSSTISNKDQFEGWNVLSLGHNLMYWLMFLLSARMALATVCESRMSLSDFT